MKLSTAMPLLAAAALGWAIAVAALLDLPLWPPLLLIAITLGLGFGIGRYGEASGTAALAFPAVAVSAAGLSLAGLLAGRSGAGLPLLVGTVPALLATPCVYLGASLREQRR